MTEKDLIKQLKSLRALGANSDWKKTNRSLLISQIKGQSTAAPASAVQKTWYGFKAFMPSSIKTFVYKPVGAITLIIALMFGASIVSVSASKGSVPGDVLYKVKLTREKIHAGITVDDGKKTDLYIGFADERLNEIDKLKDNPKKPEHQKENMKVAVSELKNQMGNVKNQLEKVKSKPRSAKEIVEVAKKVDEKVEDISNKIEQKKQELSGVTGEDEVIDDLDDAQDAAEEASDVAIDVIIEKHVSGEVETSIDELANKIEKKIKKAEDRIDEVNEDVDQLNIEKEEIIEEPIEEKIEEVTEELEEEVVDEPAVATEDTVIEGEEVVQEEGSEDTIEDVIQKPDEARKLVDEAKELLEQGDITNAFEKVKESNVITKEVEEQIETIGVRENTEEQDIIPDNIEEETTESTETQSSESGETEEVINESVQ